MPTLRVLLGPHAGTWPTSGHMPAISSCLTIPLVFRKTARWCVHYNCRCILSQALWCVSCMWNL